MLQGYEHAKVLCSIPHLVGTCLLGVGSLLLAEANHCRDMTNLSTLDQQCDCKCYWRECTYPRVSKYECLLLQEKAEYRSRQRWCPGCTALSQSLEECAASRHRSMNSPTFTNLLLYLIRFIARPLGCFFLSCFCTFGVCPRTFPARAKDPCTLPAIENITLRHKHPISCFSQSTERCQKLYRDWGGIGMQTTQAPVDAHSCHS